MLVLDRGLRGSRLGLLSGLESSLGLCLGPNGCAVSAECSVRNDQRTTCATAGGSITLFLCFLVHSLLEQFAHIPFLIPRVITIEERLCFIITVGLYLYLEVVAKMLLT